MGYLNKVLLIGRLGQDPEKRVTAGAHTVVNISLATTEYYKDQSGQKQERTEWHRVVLWNRLGEIVDQYCKKGSQLYVEGSLQTREWQDKEGNRRFSTDIVARNIQLLDSKQSEGSHQEQEHMPFFPNQSRELMHNIPENPNASGTSSIEAIDDNLPF